jgi:hypothetical protein
MKQKLHWKTETRKVKELIPYEFNPRTMSPKDVEALKESLAEFDLVEIPAIDKDNTIIAGHQRVMILLLEGRGEEIIDVRVPNRKLTEDEFKKYNIKSNLISGSWNIDFLANNFGLEFIKDAGFSANFLDKLITPPAIPLGNEKPKAKAKQLVECPNCHEVFTPSQLAE